jgi:pimeloyl-ACP methyl ester carboxylesterase
MPSYDQIAVSADGVPIHYEIHGSGSPALVFVHGWCRDRRCWDGQVQAFAPRHTVVALDLAGHGASGRDRASWTIQAFGLDVAAVVEKLGLRQAVLIGHSLGGGSIVEVARRLPDTVVGVIGVDTWRNLGEPRSRGAVSQAHALFRVDFAGTMRNRVQTMFSSSADPALVEGVAAQTSSGQWRARLSRYEPEVDMATTVLDGEIDRFLSAALAQRIQGADAIRTKWLFLGRRHRPHMPRCGPCSVRRAAGDHK